MRPPCWWWLAQIPAYNTSRPPSLLALPCVAAWLACWCRWRFVPCWPFAGRFARFRCTGGIITPAAPVALNIRPFPCLVSVAYISTSRASNWRRPCCRRCLAVFPSLRWFAWLAGRARPFQQTAAGLFPARLALPVSVYKRPVLPIFRRFGGLSALRWCPVLARCPCARFAGVGVLIR